jgi:arylsulfatase A-like enzyme
LLCGSLSAKAGEPAGAGGNQPNARLNIILIESDDQRQDTIASLGNGVIKTPGLDRLSRSGMVLTNVRNQGSYNPAVCVASRSMLMSGRSLWHYDDKMKGEVTLGELLRSAGYYTYGTGKWHNGDESLMRSFVDADNISPGFLPKGHDSEFATTAVHGGKLTKGKNVPPEHSSDLIGQTAVSFVEKYHGEKPFFMYFGFNAPHDPYTRIPKFESLYRDASGTSTMPSPPAFAAEPAFDLGVLGIRDEKLLPRPLDPASLANQNAIYYAMISHLDTWVGKLLDALKARGLDKNTLIIFTTDHGLARGSNGLLGKQNLYEHTLKIPFIVSGPGVPAGKQNDSPLYNHEVYRTIADYAGAKAPERAEGESFRPILEGGQGKPHRQVTYHGYTSLMRALVDGEWKLIEYHVKGQRHTQLFDLSNDPHEEKNLADNPAKAGKLAELRELMIAERNRYEDRDAKFWDGIGFGTPLSADAGHSSGHTQQQEE